MVREQAVLARLEAGHAVEGVEVEVGLVPVTLEVEGRGQLSEQSLICVPMAGDQSWRAG
jgi:hypothetical protein